MLNVYDILLNLLDSEHVYEFFEWNNKDDVEHIKKIPMIKITSNSLDSFINDTVIVDKEFLSIIYQKTEVFNPDRIGVIDYACLFTDGYKVLGVEFNKEGKSLFKSFLLLDEEEEILEISNEVKLTNIKYKVIKKNNRLKYLTREEEYRKNYLLRELKYAKRHGMYEKINYLYEEIYPISKKNIEEKYKLLIDDITNNYRDCYNELFKILKLSHTKKKTTSN